MASVSYGAVITELKGKVGGTVFQGSITGGVMKNKPSFKGLITTDSAIQKRSFTQITSLWKTLTAIQVADWEALRPTWLFTDRFGNSYQGSAFQVFNSYNLNRLYINRSPVTTPGAPIALHNMGVATVVVYQIGLNELAWANPLPVNYYYRFEVMQPVSPGVRSTHKSWNGCKCNICLIASPWALAQNTPATNYGHYGVLTPGMRLNFRIRAYNLNYPAPGPDSIANAIIQAGVQPTDHTVLNGRVVLDGGINKLQYTVLVGAGFGTLVVPMRVLLIGDDGQYHVYQVATKQVLAGQTLFTFDSALLWPIGYFFITIKWDV